MLNEALREVISYKEWNCIFYYDNFLNTLFMLQHIHIYQLSTLQPSEQLWEQNTKLQEIGLFLSESWRILNQIKGLNT